jgi:hypothetical protein
MNNKLLQIKSILLSSNIFNKYQDDYSEAINNYNNKYYIFRGLNRKESKFPDIWIQKPRERKSAHTDNYYNTLFSDILSSWSKYPKRNNSIICSTSFRYASNYANDDNLFYVFPKNGAKLGICPTLDIFSSFSDHNTFMEDFLLRIFDEAMNILHYSCGLQSGKGNKEDMIQFFKIFKKNMKIDSIKKELMEDINESDTGNHYLAKKLIKHSDDLYSFLNDELSPERNNFILTNIKNFGSNYNDISEVWTDSPCLLIKRNILG